MLLYKTFDTRGSNVQVKLSPRIFYRIEPEKETEAGVKISTVERYWMSEKEKWLTSHPSI